jgi:predicted aminopeptidase
MRVLILLLCVLPSLSACTLLDYYGHLANGQWQLLRARQPIAEILADEQRDPLLKQRLRQVQTARRWAVAALQLPDNGSYTRYAELDRPYVVWNVFATPAYSLQPVERCFPIAGCLAYQGYYALPRAQQRADELRAAGNDVYIGGVPAYSTLGWFDDPVLSSMMRWDDATLIGTVFHELAHQQLYLQGDTRFNESYASFVEQEGLRQYRASHAQAPIAFDAAAQARKAQFVQLVLASRERLQELYRQTLPEPERAAGKAAEFARLREDYRQLRDGPWGGFSGYDRWFADGTLNNAKLLPFGLYDEDVPAFAALYAEQGQDWARFHAAARHWSRLPLAQRQAERQRLQALAIRLPPLPRPESEAPP